jgi:hypothetical protein
MARRCSFPIFYPNSGPAERRNAAKKRASVVLAGWKSGGFQIKARARFQGRRTPNNISTARFERNYISGRARLKKNPARG